MPKNDFLQRLARDTAGLHDQGLFKAERTLSSPQQSVVRVGKEELINLCANNYLGLANNASVREAARLALDRYGYGMASVRFICGTHKFTKIWSSGSAHSSAPRTRSCIHRASTRTGACSRRCSTNKMR